MFALKKKIRIQYDAGRTEEREINYIPLRYILALLLAVLETAAVITVLILFGKYIPYFYLAMWATEIGCVIHIITNWHWLRRFIRSVAKVFAPLM